MILVKAWFGEWKEATPEEALRFARRLFWSITMLPDPEKIKRINARYLQGISFRLEDMGGHYGNTARARHS